MCDVKQSLARAPFVCHVLLVTSPNRILIDAPHDGLLISWSCSSRSSGGGEREEEEEEERRG